MAAHITAASRKGPRYDKTLSAEGRCSIENAIWLCQNCAKLIDNDAARYTVDLLRQWKRLSEEAARLAIEYPRATDGLTADEDKEFMRFYAQCFERPAFQDPFMIEGSMEASDRAIEDTITAVNTGCLRSRDGAVLYQSKGKAFLKNANWREQMDVIVDLLRAIRSRYDGARKQGVIHGHERADGIDYYCIHNADLANWIGDTRTQVLSILGEICTEASIAAPVFPRRLPRTR